MAGIIPAPDRRRRSLPPRRYTPIADINVTPLVDVMLVLLVIFMITAPLLQVGVPVDLPKTSAQQVGGKDEPLVVVGQFQGRGLPRRDQVRAGRAQRQAQGGLRREARPARLHPRRQGDQLRPHDGSDGRGDRFGLPPARPARRAGGTAARRRPRRRAGARPDSDAAPVSDGRAVSSSVEMRTPAILSAGVHVVGMVAAIVNFSLLPAAADRARAGDARLRGDRQEGGGADHRQSAAPAQGRQDRTETTKAPPPKTLDAVPAPEPPKPEVAEAKPVAPLPVGEAQARAAQADRDRRGGAQAQAARAPKEERSPSRPKTRAAQAGGEEGRAAQAAAAQASTPKKPNVDCLVDSILKNQDSKTRLQTPEQQPKPVQEVRALRRRRPTSPAS
jgi:hypothetical protein